MRDLKDIRNQAMQTGHKAKQLGLKPLICTDKKTFRANKIPFIGDYVPKGFYLLDTLFADSSGFGTPGETAMTFDQFVDRIEVGRAYAIIEMGEFQVYIGVFGVNE